jgi:hypothetical protein
VDRLQEDFEVVSPDAGVAEQIGGGGLAGEQQDAATRNEAGDLNGGFDAAHTRHNHVGEEDVGLEVARGLDGLLAAIDSGGFKAILVENHSQGIGDDALIIGNQDSGSDPAVGGTRVHEAFGRNSKRLLGFVFSEYIAVGSGCSHIFSVIFPPGKHGRNLTRARPGWPR